MNRLLLIEDEDIILKALKRLLERNHYVVECASTIEAAVALQPHSFDIVLVDLRLPGAPGTAIIDHAGPVPVVIMTSHASVRSAVEAMQQGATDYISKPFDHEELLIVLKRSLMQNLLKARNFALSLELHRQLPWQAVIEGTTLERLADDLAAALARSSDPIMLTGEPGCGRESLARTVHARGKRQEGPLLVYDPLASGQSSASAALFEAGGLIAAAHNGTLILRNPGHLPDTVQHELAALLNDQAARLTASGRSQSVQVIVIIDTASEPERSDTARLINMHPDLERCFAGLTHQVPALRQRTVDILPTAQALLSHLQRRTGAPPVSLDASAMAVLMAHPWPGNLTELEALLLRACSRQQQLVKGSGQLGAAELNLGPAGDVDGDFGLDAYFRYFVLRHQGTLSETDLASRLGISRKALWERRQKMQLLRQPAGTGKT